jgi:hypothetical protein
MRGPLLAEFAAPSALLAAIDRVREHGGRVVDGFAPFPVDGLVDRMGFAAPTIRLPMLLVGAVLGALAYAVQWYSAVVGYPIDSGGRPLHSWPVFLLVPIEVALFGAALAGVVALFRAGGLPSLHHPVFDVPEFERASQDRFFLLAEHADATGELRHVLEQAGALSVTELRS